MQQHFYSNINCAACVAKVRETLNELFGENAWQVDTQSRYKVLSFQSEAPFEMHQVNERLKPLGYQVRPAETI
jgi:copper chaperone CopZ